MLYPDFLNFYWMLFLIYYGLDGKCSPEAYVLEAWSPVQQCSEGRTFGRDWNMRALTSSVDRVNLMALLGGHGNLGGTA